MLLGAEKWAHVSVENGDVKYQYTENSDLRAIPDCPVAIDEKEISQITKSLLK